MDEEDYWNVSMNKAFNFDDDNAPFETVQFNSKIFNDGSTSELNYDELIINNEIPLNLIISDGELRQILEEQSIHDIPLPKTIAIDDELKILRRQLQNQLHSPPASSTITKILLKKPYHLAGYRTLNEKCQLLDEAIQCGDGDAILIVTLFLLNTLKSTIAVDILKQRPDAICHYLNYKWKQNEMNDLMELLNLLDKQNEKCMKFYEHVIRSCTNSMEKYDQLSRLYRDHFQRHDENGLYTQLLKNYINLLEWQRKQSKDNELFDKSVLESLYHISTICKWTGGYNDTATLSANNPAIQLANIHQVNTMQFEWIILNERARSKVWCDLELIFQKKSWKSKIFSLHIPLDRAILQLYQLNAPAAILNYFLAQITDANYRTALALKVGAEKSVLDGYGELKNLVKLESYVETLAIGSETRIYGEQLLMKNIIKNKGK